MSLIKARLRGSFWESRAERRGVGSREELKNVGGGGGGFLFRRKEDKNSGGGLVVNESW